VDAIFTEVINKSEERFIYIGIAYLNACGQTAVQHCALLLYLRASKVFKTIE
jgi:hypothetical protein